MLARVDVEVASNAPARSSPLTATYSYSKSSDSGFPTMKEVSDFQTMTLNRGWLPARYGICCAGGGQGAVSLPPTTVIRYNQTAAAGVGDVALQ